MNLNLNGIVLIFGEKGVNSGVSPKQLMKRITNIKRFKFSKKTISMNKMNKR